MIQYDRNEPFFVKGKVTCMKGKKLDMKRLAIILAAVLAVLVGLLIFFGCKNFAGKEGGSAAPGGEPVTDPVLLEEQQIQEMSMLDKMESWRGQGTDGKVDLPGDWEATVIDDASELSPYQEYFPELTGEDIARITSDTKGIVAILEIASPDLTLNYGVDEVTREGDQIFFLVSAAPDLVEGETPEYNGSDGYETPGNPHEYFLFYIPGEHYNNESLQFSFLT